MSHVLVRLRDRYKNASRMTLCRIKHQPGFPSGIDQNGTEWFYEDELEAHEESRRLTPKRRADVDSTA